jgi:hypothetical protein
MQIQKPNKKTANFGGGGTQRTANKNTFLITTYIRTENFMYRVKNKRQMLQLSKETQRVRTDNNLVVAVIFKGNVLTAQQINPI